MCYTLVYKGQPGQKILKNIYLESENSDMLQNNLHNLKEYQTYLQYIKGLLMTDLDDLRPNTVSSEARPFLRLFQKLKWQNISICKYENILPLANVKYFSHLKQIIFEDSVWPEQHYIVILY